MINNIKFKRIVNIMALTTLLFSALMIQPQQKAQAVWGVVVPIATEIGANYLMKKYYSPGSSATQPDWDDFVEDTYTKQSATDKANTAWNMDNWEPNPKKPGWGRWAVPLSLIATMFTLGGDTLKTQSPSDPSTYSAIYPGNPYGFYMSEYTASTKYDYINMPDSLKQYRWGTSATTKLVSDADGIASPIQTVITPSKDTNGATFYSVRLEFKTHTGANNSASFYVTAGAFSLLTSASTKPYQKEGAITSTGATPETDPARFTDPVTGEEMVYVETPDPATATEPVPDWETFKTPEATPTYNPDDYAVPEPTPEPIREPEPTPGTDSPDWWKWLLTPLEKILELLRELFEWLKSIFGKIPEWFTSIISKLADLLALISSWFGSFFDKLGEALKTALQPVIDLLTSILAKLGLWDVPVTSPTPGSEPGSEPLPGSEPVPGTEPTPGTEPVPGTEPTPTPSEPKPEINTEPLKKIPNVFTTKFPFSLPWDLMRAVEQVVAPGEKPEWKVTFPIPGNPQTVHLTIPEYFDPFVPFVRGAFILIFMIGLIWGTRQLMGGSV